MRITGWPCDGPTSTYPTLRTPALICRTGPKDLLDDPAVRDDAAVCDDPAARDAPPPDAAIPDVAA
jgi:hypothetical protein